LIRETVDPGDKSRAVDGVGVDQDQIRAGRAVQHALKMVNIDRLDAGAGQSIGDNRAGGGGPDGEQVEVGKR
jgi:hypothetical protein